MSPEQIMDLGGTDSRGDIYALGKILYEAVIGKMGKDTAFPLKAAHLSNPDTPFLKRLDRIIQQATAEDKGKRIPSVNVLRKALLDILEETEEPLLPSQRPRTKKAASHGSNSSTSCDSIHRFSHSLSPGKIISALYCGTVFASRCYSSSALQKKKLSPLSSMLLFPYP